MRDKVIRTPADLAGLKVRVAGATAAEVATALGATPVQMPISQVYNALQTGLIDGVITGASTLTDFKLDEVADAITLGAPLGRLTFYAVMNEGVYNGLTDDQKAALDAKRAAQAFPKAPRRMACHRQRSDGGRPRRRRKHRRRPDRRRSGSLLPMPWQALSTPTLPAVGGDRRHWPRCAANNRLLSGLRTAADGLIGLSAAIGALGLIVEVIVISDRRYRPRPGFASFRLAGPDHHDDGHRGLRRHGDLR